MTLPKLHTTELLPPLLLVLLTVLALGVAYTFRPTVTVDMGDYYDSAFLMRGQPTAFHDREAGATNTGVTSPWPAASETATIPGGRTGLWMLTIRAKPDQPADILKLTDVEINGARTGIIRRTSDSLTTLIPAELAGQETIALRLVSALAGGATPPFAAVDSLELAPAKTYRWSRESSEIWFPGLGSGDWNVTLSAIVAHPNDQPVAATVAANGVVIANLPDRRQLRDLHVLVPARLINNGDLRLTISAQPFNDPRPLGVLVEQVRVQPAGPTPLLPPLTTLFAGLVITLGSYVSLRWIGGRRWPALLCAVVIVLIGAWFLATARYPTAQFVPRLAWLALGSLVLLAVLNRLVAWLFRIAQVPLSPLTQRLLLLIFFGGFWLKTGGVLYPYFIAIDVGWHMDRVRDMLYGGQFWDFYGINSRLNDSTMPEAEWGANRPIIPYSPWYHIFAMGFTFLPLPITLSASLLSVFLDTSRVFLIALLGRKVGLNERESLFAALLYAVTPVTFLLLSWGNVPTSTGMWLGLLTTTYIVTFYQRLPERRIQIGLIVILLLTFLVYTVLGVFTGVFLVLLWPLLWLFTPRHERRPVNALGIAILVALGLALLIYYGQYILPIIERTLPYLTDKAAPGGIEGVAYDPFGLYLSKYIDRMAYFGSRGGGYGLLLSLPLGLLGWYWLRKRPIRIVLACWLAVSILFLIAGSRISMVDKHLFYLIPALALGVGALAGRLWVRGWGGRIVTASLFIFTFAAAMNLWLYRILTVRQ
jgi:hypothetical protein